MTPVDWLFDGCLALSFLLIAWFVLFARTLHRSVMLFIAFGMVSAISWARLAAPDIALVEASVGTGLTGALLMQMLSWAAPEAASSRAQRIRHGVGSFIATAAITALLSWALLALPLTSPGLSAEVEANMAHSGASHPVTAVLLNFRGYDTLFEVAVLLLAVQGIRFLGAVPLDPQDEKRVDVTLISTLFRVILPVLVVMAGYLLWVGADAPGGAFQAGAVLAGGGVLALVAREANPATRPLLVRAALLVGPTLFAVVAVAPLFSGARLLEYPLAWVKPLLFAVECALTLSIATVLWLFFPQPAPQADDAGAKR